MHAERDWWGTTDLTWWQSLGIRLGLGEPFREAFGTPEKASVTLDETPTKEAIDFLENYYPEYSPASKRDSPRYLPCITGTGPLRP